MGDFEENGQELAILFNKLRRRGLVGWDELSACQSVIMKNKKKRRFKTSDDLVAGTELCLVAGIIGRLKGKSNEDAFNLREDIIEAGKPIPDFLERFDPLCKEALEKVRKKKGEAKA